MGTEAPGSSRRIGFYASVTASELIARLILSPWARTLFRVFSRDLNELSGETIVPLFRGDSEELHRAVILALGYQLLLS